MKITMALPSRERPAGLLSVLTALDALSTGNNEIKYAVIVDHDDAITLKCLEEWNEKHLLPKGTVIETEVRHRTVNASVNAAMAIHTAELYSQVVDDCFPLTQHWDEILVMAKDLPAFCWQEQSDPDNATFLVIGEKWRQATGRFYPDCFPFWFADTWLAEVHKLAFGTPLTLISQLKMGGKRGKTTGMRDLSFWFRYYARTREERVEESKKVAKAYGVEWRERPDVIKEFEINDAHHLKKVPIYEQAFADKRPPTPIYLKCKERAFKWLHDHSELSCT